MRDTELRLRIAKAERNEYEEPQVITKATNPKSIIKPLLVIGFSIGTVPAALYFFLLPAIDKAQQNPDISPAAKEALGIFPIVFAIVFAAVILLGTVAYFFGYKNEQESEEGAEKTE